MDKQEIQSRMRVLLAEYNDLKGRLDAMQKEGKLAEFRARQTARLEEFKSKYTLEANMNAEFKPIDWDALEKSILSEENVLSNVEKGEGWAIGYNEDGMPGSGVSYYGGGTFTPFAYDETDAKRYVERETRKRARKAEKR